MTTTQKRRRATILSGAALLACLGARGALGLKLELQQTQVLPTEEGEFHMPQSISLLEGSEVVLVTAKRARNSGQTGEAASWVAWQVAGAGGNARRIVPGSIGEHVEGCVLQTSLKALCTVVSAPSAFRTLILQLDDGSVSQRKSIKSLSGVAVRGMERTAGGGALVWGVSELNPFAALIDENAGVKWFFRWPEFGVGEFYDGMVTPAGARLLAVPRKKDGSTGDDISAVELSPLGKLVSSRAFPRASRTTIPLLSGSGLIAVDARPGAAAESSRADMVLTALSAEPSILKWTRPTTDILAYVTMEGTSAVLVVKLGDAEVARAPVAGFPFPSLVAGSGSTIYVLTMDMEQTNPPQTNPPRQILRLSRFTLSRQ
jgi:hypothetical protein